MKEKVNPYRFVRIQMIHALYGDNPPLYIQQELEELQSDNDDIFGNFENTLLHPTGKTDEEIEDYIQMILFKIDLSKTMNISKIKIPKCPTNNKFKINMFIEKAIKILKNKGYAIKDNYIIIKND